MDSDRRRWMEHRSRKGALPETLQAVAIRPLRRALPPPHARGGALRRQPSGAYTDFAVEETLCSARTAVEGCAVGRGGAELRKKHWVAAGGATPRALLSDLGAPNLSSDAALRRALPRCRA